MAKKIDDRVKKVLQEQGFDWKECLWDCHGTWVMYHRYIEIAAAQNKVKYDLSEVETNSKDGIVVIKCVGSLKDNTVTTYGEASPKNNKNAYPYAMAEKRAVDRAVLKLLGLHGFIYSEDEIEHTSKPAPAAVTHQVKELSEEALKYYIDQLKSFDDDKLKQEYWKSINPDIRNQIREYTDDLASK